MTFFWSAVAYPSGQPTLVGRPAPHVFVIAIGINDFVDGHLSPLRSPESEARAVYTVLTGEATGLKSSGVLLLGSAATTHNVLDALSHVAAALAPEDVVVIYWSGHTGRHTAHGAVAADVRFYAYDTVFAEKAATSNDPRQGLSLVNDILPMVAKPDVDIVFLSDGCEIGTVLPQILAKNYPRVSLLTSTKSNELSMDMLGDEHSFTAALLRALTSETSDMDRDGYISVEESYVKLYPVVVSRPGLAQHPTIWGERVHQVFLAKAPTVHHELAFEEPVPDEIAGADELVIDGTSVKVDRRASTPNHVFLLGNPAGLAGRGITRIATAKQEYLYWREAQALKRFAKPYKRSYAVLVAIDDYDRQRDTQRRGKTGFEPRDGMVAGAEKLRAALEGLSFPHDNVVPLYNEQATSAGIERVLKSFWQGGERDDADRVFFYFGGHGHTYGGAGVLITYDFDAARPTQTGFLMRDLTTRHAENMTAHHVLFSLDACAAGLAVVRRLGTQRATAADQMAQLSIIRNDTDRVARNVLVAGTADQAALWDGGGIFTQALVAGLSGKADSNHDGIIQFLELAVYVEDEVAKRAAQFNVEQQAQAYTLDGLGTGKIVFFGENAVSP